MTSITAIATSPVTTGVVFPDMRIRRAYLRAVGAPID